MCLSHRPLGQNHSDVSVPKRKAPPQIVSAALKVVAELPETIVRTKPEPTKQIATATAALVESTTNTNNPVACSSQETPVVDQVPDGVESNQRLIDLLLKAKAIEPTLKGKNKRNKKRTWQHDTCLSIASMCGEKMRNFKIDNGSIRVKAFKYIANLVRREFGNDKADTLLPNFLKNPS